MLLFFPVTLKKYTNLKDSLQEGLEREYYENGQVFQNYSTEQEKWTAFKNITMKKEI